MQTSYKYDVCTESCTPNFLLVFGLKLKIFKNVAATPPQQRCGSRQRVRCQRLLLLCNGGRQVNAVESTRLEDVAIMMAVLLDDWDVRGSVRLADATIKLERKLTALLCLQFPAAIEN